MKVNSDYEVRQLRKIGRVVRSTIEEMKGKTIPGMTTAQLDEIGKQMLNKHQAQSAPIKDAHFPGWTCISLNEEAAHGIPGKRVIQAGDVVNIDVSASLNGFYADAGESFQVPPLRTDITQLCKYTQETMMAVIKNLKAGTKLNEIGRIMQKMARKQGYYVIENLCSHGVGKALHEEPFEIFPYYDPLDERVLEKGQVITIEPFLSTKASVVEMLSDGWTLVLPRGKGFVAQFEHTIIITEDQPIITTFLD